MNILTAFILFIILTLLVLFNKSVTVFDIAIIKSVQGFLSPLPKIIPILASHLIYLYLTQIPAVIISAVLFVKRKITDAATLIIIAFVSPYIADILKLIIQRQRPPEDLHLELHTTFSYISGHTFVSTSTWGFVAYLASKHVKNKKIRNLIYVLITVWLLFAGLSRIWMGVHYPTDVLGGYLFGYIIILIFIKLDKIFDKNN